VRIDVIRTVLGIILKNENRRVFPVGTVRNDVDQQAYRVIVIGYKELRGWLSRA
jgi:hypothetical protein